MALGYDSGSGNGPFGFGWTLGLPAITRKTDKGIPRYADDDEEEDTFILSAAEDLVPALVEENGERRRHLEVRQAFGALYEIRRYRQDMQYRSATTEDFRASVEAESGRNLSAFFQQWIYGEYYPRYRA